MKNWDELAAPWLKHEARMEAAHRPVLDTMLAAAALEPGETVLDIGVGSGFSSRLALEAVGANGAVTGVDVAPPFVARSQGRVQGATFVEGDAQTFDFGEARFDAAISMFGTMFFGDTGAAFANIARTVKPGGRFVFAAWGEPADNPWLTLASRVTTSVLGPPPEPADLSAPGPFRFHDPLVPLAALETAGWKATVETVELKLTPSGSPEEIAWTQSELGVSARRVKEEGASEADAAAILSGIAEGYTGMQDASGAVKVPAKVHIFTAHLP